MTTFVKTDVTKEQNEQVSYLLAVCKQQYRRGMEWVQVLEDGTAVATDGWRLHSVKLEPEIAAPLLAARDAYMPTHSDGRSYVMVIPTGRKLLKIAKEVVWEVLTNEDDHDFAFPDWNPVIAAPRIGQGVQKKYLIEALQSATGENVTLILTDAYIAVTAGDETRRSYAAVMPLMAGTAHLWTPLDKDSGAKLEFKTNYSNNCILGKAVPEVSQPVVEVVVELEK